MPTTSRTRTRRRTKRQPTKTRARGIVVAGRRFPALADALLPYNDKLAPTTQKSIRNIPAPSDDWLRLSPEELRRRLAPLWTSGLAGAFVEAAEKVRTVRFEQEEISDQWPGGLRRLYQALFLLSAPVYRAWHKRRQLRSSSDHTSAIVTAAIREFEWRDREFAAVVAAWYAPRSRQDKEDRSRASVNDAVEWYHVMVRELLTQATTLDANDRDQKIGELLRAVLGPDVLRTRRGRAPSAVRPETTEPTGDRQHTDFIDAVQRRYRRIAPENKDCPLPLDAVLRAIAGRLGLPFQS